MDSLLLLRLFGELNGKVDELLARDASPTVGVAEAMHLVGARSRTALHRAMIRLGVCTYARGRYRRKDILNAMGRESMRKAELTRKRHHEAIESEARSESRRKASKPNPHDD